MEKPVIDWHNYNWFGDATLLEKLEFLRTVKPPVTIRRIQLSEDLKRILLADGLKGLPHWLRSPEMIGPTEPGRGRIRIVFADYVERIDGGLDGPADRPLDRAVQHALPRSRAEKLQDKRRLEARQSGKVTEQHAYRKPTR